MHKIDLNNYVPKISLLKIAETLFERSKEGSEIL